MQERIKEIQEKAVELISRATSPEALNEARVKFLGKKGELTAILKGMKDVDPELRPKVGAWVNEARQQLEKKIDSAGKSMEAEILKQRLAAEKRAQEKAAEEAEDKAEDADKEENQEEREDK